MPKVVIVGAGSGGNNPCVYIADHPALPTEIVLIDSNHELAEGQVMDMNHGLPFVPPVHIHASEYPDCRGADVIVITAGARQKPGETRLDLVDRNAHICKGIVDSITPYNREALLLVVTNPVDIMTYAVVNIQDTAIPGYRMRNGFLIQSDSAIFLVGIAT